VEDTAMGLVIREGVGRVYHLTDESVASEYTDLQAWRESGERTALLVPLVAGGRVIGALHMGSELAEAFGFEEQLPLVSRMAGLTAIAIENARLFQEAIDRERFSAALSRVGQSVNAMLDMASVLETVCEESIAILEVEGAYIWLVEGNELIGLAAHGPGTESFAGTRRPLDAENLVGVAVVRERSPMYVNDADQPGSRFQSALPDVKASGLLGVPLLREEHAIGALVLIETDPSQPFTDADVEQASAFAVQATIAIENAGCTRRHSASSPSTKPSSSPSSKASSCLTVT
jgi:GAF domain-containing protein